MQVKTIEIP